MSLRVMRRLGWMKGVVGVAAAYALALQLLLGGFATPLAQANPASPDIFSVICHGNGDGGAPDDPAGGPSDTAKHLCQICCLSGAGVALTPTLPQLAGLEPPRDHAVPAAATPSRAISRAHSPHAARAPPHA